MVSLMAGGVVEDVVVGSVVGPLTIDQIATPATTTAAMATHGVQLLRGARGGAACRSGRLISGFRLCGLFGLGLFRLGS
ncbi:hypothetical protein D3C87_1952560 [compost metagenome]